MITIQQPISVDALFAEADRIIAQLPTTPSVETFYDVVDVASTRKLNLWNEGACRLCELGQKSPVDKAHYFFGWAADAFVGAGHIEQALEVFPLPELGSRSSMQTDRMLALKFATDRSISGHDVATLFGPRLTKYGRDNLNLVIEFLEIRLSQIQQKELRNLLQEWSSDAHHIHNGMTLFSGHASYVWTPNPTGYHFSLSPTANEVCVMLMRDAENTLREEIGIPRIGEGWVAETALYYSMKEAFNGVNVLQHGRPEWLGRQHLDIYFPDHNVAIEYQGAQHDRPIEFFGGEAAYLKTVERDQQKLSKCRRNGVKLIYVREGDSLSALIDELSVLLS